MSEERYIVRSLTGCLITPEQNGRDCKPGTEWYVMDTAYCYQVIATFPNTKMGRAKRRAEVLAERLNRLEAADERRYQHSQQKRLAAQGLPRNANGRFA